MGKPVKDNLHIYNGDSLDLYSQWEPPIVIISDDPYGVSGFKCDLHTPNGLDEWYEPHTVHPILQKYGWEYKCCNIWNKGGKSHIAGATNTKTLSSKLPICSEVCVQYVLKPRFSIKNVSMSMQEWLIYEWKRTGLPFSKTNGACEVVDAATQKYFTKCHLWYMPHVSAFEKLVEYANKF